MTETSTDPLDRFRVWADLSYHYGWSPKTISETPRWLRKIYLEELPRLRAQDKAAMIDAASFPHLDKSDQKKISRRIERATSQRAERPADKKATKQRAAAAGIGIKFVSPSKSKNKGGGD